MEKAGNWSWQRNNIKAGWVYAPVRVNGYFSSPTDFCQRMEKLRSNHIRAHEKFLKSTPYRLKAQPPRYPAYRPATPLSSKTRFEGRRRSSRFFPFARLVGVFLPCHIAVSAILHTPHISCPDRIISFVMEGRDRLARKEQKPSSPPGKREEKVVRLFA